MRQIVMRVVYVVFGTIHHAQPDRHPDVEAHCNSSVDTSTRVWSLLQHTSTLREKALGDDASAIDAEIGDSPLPDLPDGLFNEGKVCNGRTQCNGVPGDCSYCGTGQCCGWTDYSAGVVGCELGPSRGGRTCGAFKGELSLKNEGRACWGFCNSTAGNCIFCGTGQCCRRRDGEMCVPGCELASTLDQTKPVCGNFESEPEACTGNEPVPSPSLPHSSGDGDNRAVPTPATTHVDPNPTELRNEGVSCGAICKGSGSRTRGGDCLFCGNGQCCANIDWYRGVPGCEKAEGVMQAVCGDFKEPYPEPDEFRVGLPVGTATTPPSPPKTPRTPVTGWIREIEATPDDDVEQAYAGVGGKPWNTYEMALARDMIASEIRRASRAWDEISSAKFLRLAFHDCLRHVGGGGGCDGCLNWNNVGFEFEGRVEDREHLDFERNASNNGLQHVVAFLEYVYNYDFGLGSSCWGTGNVVGNFRIEPTSTVKSLTECQQLCQNTPECAYFQTPKLAFLSNGGPCWLSREGATLRLQSGGNLIAGHANCAEFANSSWSLKNRGKSRADLWAFASLVAIEEAIDRNNNACDGGQGRGGIPGMSDVMCLQFEGEPQCKIWPSRPLVFKTGRRDCVTTQVEPYMAEEHEIQPDEHFNGSMTVRFMEEHFAFSGKETVAIMGAHTLGKFHQQETGHKYLWTTDFQAFSNQYYRNVVGRPDYFFDDTDCTKVGDAWGNRAAAVWIAKQNQAFKSGGPVQWIKKQVACPNCAAKSYERGGRHPERLAYDRDCCLNKPPGAFCRPDGPQDRPEGSSAIDFDDDFSWGCEYSHFIFGRDETALSVDMGLMYSFDVDLKGFPSGCPGLGGWGPSTPRWSDWDCGIDGRPWLTQPVNESIGWDAPRRIGPNATTRKACNMACPKNDYVYPGDTMSLSEHAERFADDQAAWIEEFFPAMEKMISNGYGDELVVSWPPNGASLLAAARAEMH